MKKEILFSLALAASFATVPAVGSAQPNNDKVTICHRTNAPNNAYVRITVSTSAVDGQGNNDHSHHTGPVASSQAEAEQLKAAGTKWGDIIPPFNGNPGLNWDAEGQAVFNNGCEFVSGGNGGGNPPPVTPGGGQDGGPGPVAAAPQAPAQGGRGGAAAAAPAGGAVNAGGGSSTTSAVAVAGLGGSLSLLGYAVRRFLRE